MQEKVITMGVQYRYMSLCSVLARVHPTLLCNLAGAYLLKPTYACPIVCLSEPQTGYGTDKTLCCYCTAESRLHLKVLFSAEEFSKCVT